MTFFQTLRTRDVYGLQINDNLHFVKLYFKFFEFYFLSRYSVLVYDVNRPGDSNDPPCNILTKRLTFFIIPHLEYIFHYCRILQYCEALLANQHPCFFFNFFFLTIAYLT